jgi:hypothetical protein
MRDLIFADGNEVAFIQKDIGGLKDRVSKVAIDHVLDMEIAHLVFKSRVPFKPVNGYKHGEYQVELCMFFYPGLAEHRTLDGVNSCSEPIDHHIDRVLVDIIGIKISSKDMPISNQMEVFVIILEVNPIFESTYVMPYMELACGTHPA